MRTFNILAAVCAGALLFAAQSAQAATINLKVSDSWSKWNAQAIVEVPGGYSQSYLSSDRTYVDFRKTLSRTCLVQASASTRSDTTTGNTPNPAESVNTYLSLYVNKGSLGRGAMRNHVGSAGKRAIAVNGAWGAQKSATTNNKSAVLGFAFYASAAKYKNLFVNLGIRVDLAGSSGCSGAQILGQANVVKRMISVFKVS